MFGPALSFLDDLAAHNDKAWFEANAARYERDVKRPAIAFVEAIAPRLEAFSPHLRGVARGPGSSIGRLHRDTRFSADKSPFKDWLGFHFRHERGKEAPGLYVRVSPTRSAIGAGVWRFEPSDLDRVRQRVADPASSWSSTRSILDAEGFAFIGESAKRVPKPYTADHPHGEDLRRKTFGVARDVDARLPADQLVDAVVEGWRASWPLVEFLCDALELPL